MEQHESSCTLSDPASERDRGDESRLTGRHIPVMGQRLEAWLDGEVRPFRDKPISWLSQYHFFRDPMRPTYSDMSYFFSPADGIILYQREVEPDECIVDIKGKAYSLRDALRDPHYSARSLVIGVGQGISFDDPTNKVPHIHVYNLTFGREITRNLMVEVSYVGTQVRDLSVGRNNINDISAADLVRGAAYLQERVPNPFAGLLPGSGFNGPTVQRQQLLRPYPQFGNITQNSISIGRTWYNALQVIVKKRMSHGLKLTSSYTYSRTKEKNSFLNPQDTELVEQVTDYDRPHLWVFSGTYELPFGRGRRFGQEARGIVEQLIGGWQLNWELAVQSGRPLDQPGGLEPIASARLDEPTPARWFNTCYLDLSGVPQKCQPGESPVWRQRPPFTLRTTPNRFSDIRVPWKPTIDASVFKNFRLSDRYRVQLRIEAFNALNSVIYPSPNTDFASQNFGKIPDPKGTIYFPRNVQLGLKLFF